MVYGTLVNGVYKPSYNWGPHLVIERPHDMSWGVFFAHASYGGLPRGALGPVAARPQRPRLHAANDASHARLTA